MISRRPMEIEPVSARRTTSKSLEIPGSGRRAVEWCGAPSLNAESSPIRKIHALNDRSCAAKVLALTASLRQEPCKVAPGFGTRCLVPGTRTISALESYRCSIGNLKVGGDACPIAEAGCAD